jgi:hypothetical protein
MAGVAGHFNIFDDVDIGSFRLINGSVPDGHRIYQVNKPPKDIAGKTLASCRKNTIFRAFCQSV